MDCVKHIPLNPAITLPPPFVHTIIYYGIGACAQLLAFLCDDFYWLLNATWARDVLSPAVWLANSRKTAKYDTHGMASLLAGYVYRTCSNYSASLSSHRKSWISSFLIYSNQPNDHTVRHGRSSRQVIHVNRRVRLPHPDLHRWQSFCNLSEHDDTGALELMTIKL